MLCDGNTFNYGYIGSRATGSDAGDYMVVGPDWQGVTPAGIKKVFRSTTQFSIAAYRTHPSIRRTCQMSKRYKLATRCNRYRST